MMISISKQNLEKALQLLDDYVHDMEQNLKKLEAKTKLPDNEAEEREVVKGQMAEVERVYSAIYKEVRYALE